MTTNADLITTWRTASGRASAFAYGVADGMAQPYELSTSRNVEDLPGDFWRNQNALDLGINLGQFLRAGRASQSWTEGYPIPMVRRHTSVTES